MRLTDGRTVVATEEYLRRAILDPRRRGGGGYPPVIPKNHRILVEGEIEALVAYLKNLGDR